MQKKPDLAQLEKEFAPLMNVHGVELVALEWFQGPGHGILRLTVDEPNGDPRVQDPSKSIAIDRVAAVTRDVSTALDTIEFVDGAYTLEVTSPGPERAVQKRADFDRFAALPVRVEMRDEAGAKRTVNGTLRGTKNGASDASFLVLVEVANKVYELASERIHRAKLLEVKPAVEKSAGSSRRQERLAAREKARAINAAHQAAKGRDSADNKSDAPAGEHRGSEG